MKRREIIKAVAVSGVAALMPTRAVALSDPRHYWIPVQPPQIGQSEHVCYCVGCRPDVYPFLPKQGEQHIAIRFGDRWWNIWLDGQKVECVTEALAGEQGYVLFFSESSDGHRHVCGRFDNPRHGGHKPLEVCQHVAYGRVEIRPMEREA